MRRREFLAASAAAAMTALVKPGLAQQAESARQVFELRTYHFASPAKREAFEQFLADAAVPAFNRAGISPVGVWKRLAQDNPNLKLSADPDDLWVLLPHNSLESVAMLEDRLAADQAFQMAGKSILSGAKSDPAYTRYESTLLLAMEGVPRVSVPSKAPTRVFELRTYESHNVEKARNKLEMFNAGEFPIFGRAGMPGVFFGGAIAGSDLPQLTYMIVTDDMKDVKKGWGAFFNDPQWKKLSSNPGYKDNVSKVISRFLRPAGGSQI
jgi:hypothetical protein